MEFNFPMEIKIQHDPRIKSGFKTNCVVTMPTTGSNTMFIMMPFEFKKLAAALHTPTRPKNRIKCVSNEVPASSSFVEVIERLVLMAASIMAGYLLGARYGYQ